MAPRGAGLMYTITRDTSKSRVIIAHDGPRDYPIEIFWQEFKEAVHFAKCARPFFDVLVDHSRTTILPQDRTKNGEAMAIWCLENGLRKSANVAPSAIMRMQLQRITDRNPQFAYFETRKGGERWLDERGLSQVP